MEIYKTGGWNANYTEGYYKKRPCAELCALAADLLEDYLKNIT